MPLLKIVYAAGALWAGCRFIAGLLRLYAVAARATRVEQQDGCVLVHTQEMELPVSFFHWIFLPFGTPAMDSISKNEAVMAHERAHARGLHTADVLVAEVICILFWFHPIAHWYRRAMRQVHEYLADAAASSQTTRKQYGLLLIRQAPSGNVPAFVHHFFQSPLKQRLIMLTKQNSPAIHGWKYAALLPLFALSLWCCKDTDENLEKQIAEQVAENAAQAAATVSISASDASLPVVTQAKTTATKPPTVKTAQKSGDTAAGKGDVLDLWDIDEPPAFPGGEKELFKYLGNNIKYPKSAADSHIVGMVVISLIVEKDGSIGEAKIERGLVGGCAEEALRVVSAMPKWTPGRKNGDLVRVSYTIPIRFKLE